MRVGPGGRDATRVAERVQPPPGGRHRGSVEGDLAGAVMVGGEPGQPGGCARGGNGPPAGVVAGRGQRPRRRFVDLVAAEVRGGAAIRVVVDQPRAAGVVDVARGRTALGHRGQVTFLVPSQLLRAGRAGSVPGLPTVVVVVVNGRGAAGAST